jgi:hypothetical protein
MCEEEEEFYIISNEDNIVLQKNDNNYYKITSLYKKPKSDDKSIFEIINNDQLFELLFSLNKDIFTSYNEIKNNGIHNLVFDINVEKKKIYFNNES